MLSLSIQVPYYAKAEAEYTFNILFGLISSEVNINYISSEEDDYVITSDSNNLLTISNRFFTNQPAEAWYTKYKIPNDVMRASIDIGTNQFDITPLYGVSTFSMNNRKLNIDIVASAFFMLTRWEETISTDLDEHGRFDQKQALAVKAGFIHFPIVNEFAAILKAALELLGVVFVGTRKPNVYMTFDIDTVRKYGSVKTLLGDLTKRYTTVSQACMDIEAYTRSLFNSTYDPYFCFDYILDALNKHNKQALFYIKTHITHVDLDENKYSVKEPKIRALINQMINEGHNIGLHPSYETATSKALLEVEISTLQNEMKRKIKDVRMHYLRMTVPDTLTMLSETGFTTDSSSMYSRHFGFRNGICTPFMWFNIQTRTVLPLEELPPIAMTTSGLEKSLADQQQEMMELIDQVAKYNGEVALIWHNSDLDTQSKRAYFEAILKYTAPYSNN